MDPQQRRRILDDLKGSFKGELLFDAVSRGLYSTDASIFRVEPAGVAVPRDEEDVCLLVRYAAENRIPLIPRGAGTGVAGESLGPGLVVDLSRHFRAILGADGDTVRVQPGVTCRALNEFLAPLGRRFAPDPANADQCTVGGMLANNASGSRALRHGYTRDHVAGLRVVLDNGEPVAVAAEPVHPDRRPAAPDAPTPHLQDIVSATALLLAENAALIEECRPRTPFNRCGYLLGGVLAGDTVDLPKLLVGSEGTLAVFTEATLRTIPRPGGRALVLLGFDSTAAALRAAGATLPTGPSACELIDRRLLSLARGSDAANVAALVPAGAEAVLLVEYEADAPGEAGEAARRLPRLLARAAPGLHHRLALEPAELDRLWRLREIVLPSLHGLRTGAQPVALIEDVGVPQEHLALYMHRLQDILQEHELTASFLVHAGSGQVHARPFLDLARPGEVGKLRAVAERAHALALELGGTVSTQHGTGLARTPWVRRQYGALYPVFRQLKDIFDPLGIFNPGKIVEAGGAARAAGPPGNGHRPADDGAPPLPDPGAAAAAGPAEGPAAGAGFPLRAFELADPAERMLLWEPGGVGREALKCNGCGSCRVDAPPARMCPVFHATHGEAATPRAKANLFRQVLSGAADAAPLSAGEVREVADLCVNCKMCRRECPARVNVPKLMLEAKAANVAEHGLYRKDWFFARLEGFARWGSALSLVVNAALASPAARRVLELALGVSRRRRLPRFNRRAFLTQAHRRGLTRKPPPGGHRVAYFLDLFANYNDPSIAEATARVLAHNGIDLHVPPGQRGCGMAALAHGDVDTARDVARANLRALGKLAREGYTILCSEPTAALTLSQDYLDLVDDPEAEMVAARTVELTRYLWALYTRGKLRTDFGRLRAVIGHHVPCHLKALGDDPPRGPQLLALIPGVEVRTVDVSCSGMAGTFGLKDEGYDASLRAGAAMLDRLRAPGVLFGSTECSACRMQIEDGAGKRTLHPVQYLALAYGLMPELADRLRKPVERLVL